MTRPAPPPSVPHPLGDVGSRTIDPPSSWEDLRREADIQFEPVEIPPPEPETPGLFERALKALFEFLGEVLAPVGRLIGASWPVLQWVLLGLAVAFALYLAWRLFRSLNGTGEENASDIDDLGWVPSRSESIALLEDADALAAEGRYDEATHLLLLRSVSQIAAARPDWVEPSSTARELAALPRLSSVARTAFATIADRVERSLFALGRLGKEDWEVARAAYADFAGSQIGDAA